MSGLGSVYQRLSCRGGGGGSYGSQGRSSAVVCMLPEALPLRSCRPEILWAVL